MEPLPQTMIKFQPNRMAQGLARGRTQTLGVLVPSFTKRYFYLEVLQGIEQSASANDYSLIIYDVEHPEQMTSHIDFLARTRRIDALVIIGLSGHLIPKTYRKQTPFPLACVDTEAPGAVSISVDHEQGMYLAVRHLAKLGHQRIALIDRLQDPVSGTTSPARQRGYRKACKEAGLTVPSSYLVLADYSQEGGLETAAKLLSLPQPPTALACASDHQAIGAIRAIEEQGLRVGADVAVTGYHDTELAQYASLTTVRVPAFDMGQAVAELLVRALADQPEESQDISFPPELIVRTSCGARLTSARR